MNNLQLNLLFNLLLLHNTLSAPLQDSSNNHNILSKECIECLFKANKNNQTQETQLLTGFQKTFKKDVFVSRGWGAGGMPFNVLYMNPSYSSKTPATETVRKPADVVAMKQQQQQAKQHVPQLRNSLRQKNIHRISHSVIPQLFVSYGWGPHGKK